MVRRSNSRTRRACARSVRAIWLGGITGRIQGLRRCDLVRPWATTNVYNPHGFFNYYWVDDHVNVALDIGHNTSDTDASLRSAMALVLGASSIYEKKFKHWSPRIDVLGLSFDTDAGTVAMPPAKIKKAKSLGRTRLSLKSPLETGVPLSAWQPSPRRDVHSRGSTVPSALAVQGVRASPLRLRQFVPNNERKLVWL